MTHTTFKALASPFYWQLSTKGYFIRVMKNLTEFNSTSVEILFTDIDDTLTTHGKLPANSYSALWDLKKKGIKVVPVTGRPAGWCEMIARFWPVEGIVGENGGFYFRYDETQKKMLRHFAFDETTQQKNRQKLEQVRTEVLREVPGSAVASDQFTRLMDLAIDFCEDVPRLPESAVQKIVQIFEQHGAQAKVSSIHVNGWFGEYNKLSMCREFAARELNLSIDTHNKLFAFSGDSPNDEPMFEFFENSFAVANIRAFLPTLRHWPAYVSPSEGGDGFVEIARALLR